MKKKINLPINGLLLLLVIVWIFPIFWLILTAFRGEPGQFVSYIFPKEYTLDNFKYLFKNNPDFPFLKWVQNTLVVSIASCLLSTFITVLYSSLYFMFYILHYVFIKIKLFFNIFSFNLLFYIGIFKIKQYIFAFCFSEF